MGENKIKWLTEDRVESLILCDIVCLRGYQMQFTCRFKSLSRAPRYSTHAFHVYFPTCITWWPLQTTLQPLQKKIHAFIFTPFFFLFSTRFWGALRKRRGRKEEKKLLPALPPFSPEWNKAAFWGGVLSCITQQEEQGKQTGPDSSNRGSCSAGWGGALGVNQSWTAKIVLIQREKEGSEGRNSLDRVFCLVHKRVNRKSQSGERHIPCYMKV